MASRPALTGLPVGLVVAGRRVLVVGAGRIAARKIGPLLDLGARVEVVAPAAGATVAEWADAGRLQLHRRPFAPDDVSGAWLVVAATDDPAVNAAVCAAAEAARIWADGATGPENGSYTPLAAVRRGDLVVAVGTGGRSPALTAHLRRNLEQLFGPEYGTLLDLLAQAREDVRASGRPTDDADWQRAFDEGIVEMVRDGRHDEAKELLRTCL